MSETKEITIFVDHREEASGIIELVSKLGARMKTMQLPVGDFLVSERTVVERKTGTDFLQSIIDGRLFNQAEAMIDNFEKGFIIVEGEVYGVRYFHENAIRGAFISLFLDYGIPVIQTRNMDETASYIYQLAKKEQIGEKRNVRLRGEKRKMSLSMQQRFITESLPGVGPTLAKELLKHFGTVENIFKANERELREVKKIGRKKAKEIRRLVIEKYLEEGKS